MLKSEQKKTLQRAQAICQDSGAQLTEKRKAVLTVLLQSPVPLSAYEITDRLLKDFTIAMPANSVYRILSFLQEKSLVHKLNSLNKFLACAHIACNHEHEIQQFLMCNSCESVKEIAIPKDIISELGDHIKNAGYHLTQPQLEFHCECDDCFAA